MTRQIAPLLSFLILVFSPLARAQVRLDPPSKTINAPGDQAKFTLTGVPPNVSVALSITYPAGGVANWLGTPVRNVSDNTINVPTSAGAQTLKTGVYTAYLNAFIGGAITLRVLIIMDRVRDEVRFRFTYKGQIVSKLPLSAAAATSNIIVDYQNSAGAPVLSKSFRVVVTPTDPGTDWISVTPASGNTPATFSVATNGSSLPARDRPYTATIIVYERTIPDNQSSLIVEMPGASAVAGAELTSGMSRQFAAIAPSLNNGENGFFIDVPDGAGTLQIEATANLPTTIYIRRGADVAQSGATIIADARSTGASQNPSLVLPSPPAGRYFIALGSTGSGVLSGFVGAKFDSAGFSSAAVPVMAHIATGGDWKTTFILVNTASSATAFQLDFKDDNGFSWTVPVLRVSPAPADLGNVASLSASIPAGGIYTYQTREQPQAQIRSGSAQLVSGSGIQGQAIFQRTIPGGFDYEAAVPMNTGNVRFTLPFDNVTSGGIQTVTSAAVVSAADPSNVSIRIRDENGQLLGFRTLAVGKDQHIADTMEGMAGAAVRDRRGTVEFQSDGTSLTALGLRFRDAFTSFGVMGSDNSSSPPGSLTMPQIAAGGDWKTTLLLANTTDSPQPFTLAFRRQNGTPWSIDLLRAGPATATIGPVFSISDTIPARGLYSYQSRDNSSIPVESGYAVLTLGTGIQGQGIFQQSAGSGRFYEAASPMQSGLTRFLLPFDNVPAGGRNTDTSVAILNPGSASVPVAITVRDENGQVIGTSNLTLAAGQHMAETLVRLIGAVTSGRRGTVEFSTGGTPINALGLRFRGAFTSFAIIPKP